MELKQLEKYKAIATEIYKKHPNIPDDKLSDLLLQDHKAGFKPSQRRNEDGTWGSGGSKITVYRGRGNNYEEGENEGFLWVATDRSTALNYAALDKDGNWVIDEFEIDNPENPFKFPYKRPGQYVIGENVANIFRQHLYRQAKSGDISLDQWRAINEKVKLFESAAGNKVESLLTKLNKPEAASLASEIITDLGFDVLEVSENGIVTYGIPKGKKAKLKKTYVKAGFDPGQRRGPDGEWISEGYGMTSFEQEIKNNDFESAGVYDKDGNEIFVKKGGASSVTFTDEEKDLMRGGVLTHNHPGRSSFSSADINFLFSTGLTDMRVINSDGDIFVMTKKQDYDAIFNKFGLSPIQLLNRNYRDVFEKVSETTEKFILKYTDKAVAGEISSDQLFKIISALSANESHLTWETIAKTDFGRFALNYEKL